MAEMSGLYWVVPEVMSELTEAWQRTAHRQPGEACLILIPVPPLGYQLKTWQDFANVLSAHPFVASVAYGNPMSTVMTDAERATFSSSLAGFVCRCTSFDAVQAALRVRLAVVSPGG